MRLWFLLSIVLLTSVLVVRAQASDQNPDTVILTFDMRGGQKPRTADGPVLQIYADGKVIARATKPGDLPVTIHLSQEELTALLEELVAETHILTVTTATIEDELAGQKRRVGPFPDAPVTFLSIDLPQGSTEIQLKSVSALARLIPEAPSIQNLYRIQRQLMNFARHVNATAG